MAAVRGEVANRVQPRAADAQTGQPFAASRSAVARPMPVEQPGDENRFRDLGHGSSSLQSCQSSDWRMARS